MQNTLQIIDNLIPDYAAAKLRSDCLKIPFFDFEHKGETYPNVAAIPDEWTTVLAHALAHTVGCAIDVNLSFVRVSTEHDDTPHWIHADNGEAEYAAVYYLSDAQEHVEQGTAFWRHRETGLSQVPANVTAEQVQSFTADANDEDKWDRELLVPQRFNRLITYPCNLFHSRYPRFSPGEDAASGRLIWCAFYNWKDV